jgi:hypothetical protein
MKTKVFPASSFALKGDFAFSQEQPVEGKFKVKIVARSANAVSVPFMGPVMHDFAGMTCKPKFPIDYNHDEIIGAGEVGGSTDDGAVINGELIPFKSDDRASKVIHDIKNGIPYEASIYFPPSTPDDLKIEELEAGQTAEVNGQKVNGPMTIIRKWCLRGVAVTPYGMDSSTATLAAMRDNKTEYSVSVINEENESMTDKEKLEAEAKAKAEKDAADAQAFAAKQKADADALAAVKAAEDAKVQAAKAESRESFAAMCTEFGEEFAAQAFKAGKSIDAARVEYSAKLKKDNEALKAENEQIRAKLDMPGFQGSDKGGGKTAFAQLSPEQQKSVETYCAKHGADREKIAEGMLPKAKM